MALRFFIRRSFCTYRKPVSPVTVEQMCSTIHSGNEKILVVGDNDLEFSHGIAQFVGISHTWVACLPLPAKPKDPNDEAEQDNYRKKFEDADRILQRTAQSMIPSYLMDNTGGSQGGFDKIILHRGTRFGGLQKFELFLKDTEKIVKNTDNSRRVILFDTSNGPHTEWDMKMLTRNTWFLNELSMEFPWTFGTTSRIYQMLVFRKLSQEEIDKEKEVILMEKALNKNRQHKKLLRKEKQEVSEKDRARWAEEVMRSKKNDRN